MSVALLDDVCADRIISKPIWPPKISGSFSARLFSPSGVRWKTRFILTVRTQLMSWRWPSQNTFGMWTVLYRTRSSRTQFGVSINVWRLAGDTLNITCNFLYCNHQVHRDFFDHPVYRVSCGLRSAVTSNDILYAGLRTVIRSHYISQQMHLNKHSSWQVPNCYMFRHGVAILREYARTAEYDFVIL